MGKRKIAALLAQIEANQQKQAEVDALIFTVAQVAVNELAKRIEAEAKALEEG